MPQPEQTASSIFETIEAALQQEEYGKAAELLKSLEYGGESVHLDEILAQISLANLQSMAVSVTTEDHPILEQKIEEEIIRKLQQPVPHQVKWPKEERVIFPGLGSAIIG